MNPSQLATARARLNTRMTEKVWAGTYSSVLDEATGASVRTRTSTAYEGPARVKYRSVEAESSVAAGQLVVLQGVVVSIPKQQDLVTPGPFAPSGSVLPEAIEILPEGTTVEVLESTADPVLVGRTYTITGAPSLGQTTAHRYPAQEAS